jgi:hypothetical protein
MLLPVTQWITFEIYQVRIMVSLSVRLSTVTSSSLLSRMYIHIQHFAMGRRTLHEFACKIWENDTMILLAVVACRKELMYSLRWTCSTTYLSLAAFLDFQQNFVVRMCRTQVSFSGGLGFESPSGGTLTRPRFSAIFLSSGIII